MGSAEKLFFENFKKVPWRMKFFLKLRFCAELGGKARAELGEQFDIREFHAQVLETGAVPLQLLEDKINRWIEEVKNSES